MLDGAGDADGEVQLRRNDFAGLTDLQLIRHISGVDRGARRTDRGTQLFRKVEDQLELFGRAQRTATGHDPVGGLQVRTFAAAGLQADVAGVAGVGSLRATALDLGAVVTLGGGRKRSTANGSNHDRVGRRLDRDDRVAGVDRALEAMAVQHFLHIGDLVDAKQCRHARHQVTAERGRGSENVAVVAGESSDLRGEPGGDGLRETGIGNREHAADTFKPCSLGRDFIGAIGKHHHIDRIDAEPAGAAQGLGGGRVECAGLMLGNDQYARHVRATPCS